MADLFRTIATLGFFALIFPGFGFVVAHLAGPAFEPVQAAAHGKNLIDGRVTAVLDKQVVGALPGTPGLDGLMAGLTYLVLDDAGPQVRAGCPGWLFITEEIAFQKGGDANLAARVKIAAKVRDVMKARGVEMLVMPVPDKISVSRDGRCGLPVSRQAQGRLAAWRAATADLGLQQVDVITGFPADGYLRTDTHWNSAGARYAAEKLAAAITARLGPGSEKVELTQGPPQPRIGDLMALSGLSRSYTWSGPAPDMQGEVSSRIIRSGGLLDDVPPPSVVLIGTSFSLRSGFPDFLAAALAREVGQKSREGGAFAGAMLEILLDNPHVLDGTRLVVWELPVRTLTYPLTEAERRFLGDEK
jgi:alginate O-acetyltransferase complex protein AlgJ